ncbi:MAG: transposase [Planctomycetia bacterium]|nr:transposase [Planctomycetia bacterium]
MPNHVHSLFTPVDGYSLSSILQSWKSFTANRANAELKRAGAFWQDDYFDRYVRDYEQFDQTLWYIAHNPVSAGLCSAPSDWPYSHVSAK